MNLNLMSHFNFYRSSILTWYPTFVYFYNTRFFESAQYVISASMGPSVKTKDGK